MNERARQAAASEPTTVQRPTPTAQQTIHQLRRLAIRGLPGMWRAEHGDFAQTVRLVPGPEGPKLRPEGVNRRYSAIVSLGAARLDEGRQREVLGGSTAAEFAARLAERAVGADDTGVLALAAWAVAEVGDLPSTPLLSDLDSRLASGAPVPTVDLAWMICAAAATRTVPRGPAQAESLSERILARGRERLLDAQGPGGLFPHVVPADSQARLRAHVGCFADQVYPIQALARLSGHDDRALAAAASCADRIVALQGEAGQWWWHYDARGDTVIEGFPVYSVHQHAMAPMALRELQHAGGGDRTAAITNGMTWLHTHPEVVDDLIDPDRAMVWRKVGRREPPKLVRRLAAATTALNPTFRLPALDVAFPAVVVDRECRPYELGWLLYAWSDSHRIEEASLDA